MTIVHPNLTTKLTRETGGFFPDTGAVQAKTITNNQGNPSASWSNVSGLDEIRCAIAAVNANEVRAETHAYSESTHKALLDGSYPTIDATAHRFLVGSIAYDILGVEHDSQGVTTRLMLRQVAV